MITVQNQNHAIKLTSQQLYRWLVNAMDDYGVDEKKAYCLIYWLPSIHSVQVYLDTGRDSFIKVSFVKNITNTGNTNDFVVSLQRTGLEPGLCNLIETSV